MEFRRVGDLEQHVLHHVAAERALELERLALEEHVVEAPGLGGERRRVTHLPGPGDEREPYRARSGIARGPALARAGVRRVAVDAQRLAGEPGLRHRGRHLLLSAAEPGGGPR